MVRAYALKDFTPKQIRKAKEFVAVGILGFVEASLDQQVSRQFDMLEDRYFTDDDNFNFTFTFSCSGNALVAALGAAKKMTK